MKDLLRISNQGAGRIIVRMLAALLAFCLTACAAPPWNNPYSLAERDANVFYSSFSERPKHLDPVRSYSANEYAFIGQIYEPLLQYHFLKRPYALVPLTVEEVPQAILLDENNVVLPATAPAEQVAYSEYEVRIKKGIEFQPHPAFARAADGSFLYHTLTPEQIAGLNTLGDFQHSASRELTAQDYVYQIKRLAFPRLHSPIAGVMSEYIVGFAALAESLDQAEEELKAQSGEAKPFLDLRRFSLAGVTVLDKYRFRIRLKGKYPQFVYWMAMPFFAPMPWKPIAFMRSQAWRRATLVSTGIRWARDPLC